MHAPKSLKPPKVHQTVSGSVKVQTTTAQQKLGPNAWRVWITLLWRRDADGISWATYQHLAEETRLTVRQVQRAMSRLASLGFIEPKAKRGGHLRWARRVCGDYRAGQVVVPHVTSVALAAAGARGGDTRSDAARAGRKEQQQAVIELAKARARRKDYQTKPVDTPDQTGRHKIVLKKEFGFINKTKGPCGPSKVSKVDWSVALSGEGLKGPQRFIVPRSGTDVIPAFDSHQVFRWCAKTPSPPLLDTAVSLRARAEQLARAYRGAYELRTGKGCFVFRENIRESRYWGSLKDACEACVEHSIPLGAWCLWSFDVWASSENAKAAKCPPVNFVWSAKRIAERRGWFRTDHGYHGGRIWITASMREYQRRWKKVADHLYCLPPEVAATDLAQREAMRLHMPGGLARYAELAREESAEQQRHLQNAIARSDWSVL